MNIYNFHPETGEFIGRGLADADPLEPGNWLIPAYACKKAPPLVGENKVAVWNGSSWDIFDDFRGGMYYVDSKRPITINKIGEKIPEGASLVPIPPTSEELVVMALAKKDELLTAAALRIAPLEDAVDLGEATDADIVSLKSWKLYRVAVNRVEQQPGFPHEIEWPLSPS